MDFLNNLIEGKFIMVTVDLKVHVKVVSFPEGNGLAFIVTQPPIPAYTNEKSMFGKSLRLLIYIQYNYGLMAKLKTHNLTNVMVTEVNSPQSMNKYNTTTFNYEFLVETFVALQNAAFGGIEEETIKTVISLSAHL